MKKWIALLLMFLFVGMGVVYADIVQIYTSYKPGNNIAIATSSNCHVYFKNQGRTREVHDAFGNYTVTYDNDNYITTINGITNGSEPSELKVIIYNGTKIVFQKTYSVKGHFSITIRLTENGWKDTIVVDNQANNATKSPIPTIAIVLTLIAIPLMTLRKLK